MLSVANIATLLGGTGRCALDCIKALPDWKHRIVFVNGHAKRLQECRAAFPCDVNCGAGKVARACEEFRPDIVLYHNQGPREMPAKLPGAPVRVYYQHSAHPHHGRFDKLLMVSMALASRCGFGRDRVLHQPVSVPTRNMERPWAGPVTIGKICTPTASKWPRESVQFYTRLLIQHETRFEFVGAPAWLSEPLQQRFGARVLFHPASVSAQNLLWSWHAMLHDGPWESYGRTVCEAQQCGSIPIVRAQGGVCEQIDPGNTGFLCHDNFEEWSQAVGEVIRWTAGGGADFCVKSQLATFAGRARGSLSAWRRKFLEMIGVEDSQSDA